MVQQASPTPGGSNPKFDELIDTFEMLGDWEERYRHLIELGRKLPPMADAEKTDAHKVRGCMSQVWLAGRAQPGNTPDASPLLHFDGDSDAHIVKGLIAVLFLLYSDRSAREILETDIEAAFAQLGLESHLSMNRRNGFYAMVERIKLMAAQAAASA